MRLLTLKGHCPQPVIEIRLSARLCSGTGAPLFCPRCAGTLPHGPFCTAKRTVLCCGATAAYFSPSNVATAQSRSFTCPLRLTTYHESIYCCSVPDYGQNVRSFDSSRTKRRVNAFSSICIPPNRHARGTASGVVRCRDKRKYLEMQQVMRKVVFQPSIFQP